MNKIKLRGCNCTTCRRGRRDSRKLDKFITRYFNRKIRRENARLCRPDNQEAVFDITLSYYYD